MMEGLVATTSRRAAPGRVAARYEARRDHILDIAVSAFRLKGYAGTSMQDIGRALERTKGSLYYYFPDKEAILFQCHERALQHILAVARAVPGRTTDPAAALRELIERHVEIMVHEFHGTALALEVGALTGRRLARVVAMRDRYERILRGVVGAGVRSGVFRRVDVKLATFSILGAINWIGQWYRVSGGLSAADIGRSFADLFLQALRASRVPAQRGRPASRRRS
jgi:AcrR family transcriptional regulator